MAYQRDAQDIEEEDCQSITPAKNPVSCLPRRFECSYCRVGKFLSHSLALMAKSKPAWPVGLLDGEG